MTNENKGDTAGQLMGWSLENGMKQKKFDELMEFPCEFTFKIIGMAADDFADQVVKGIEAHRSQKVDVVRSEVRPSKTNKYLSLTLTLRVADGQSIYDVYDACEKMPNIKFVI